MWSLLFYDQDVDFGNVMTTVHSVESSAEERLSIRRVSYIGRLAVFLWSGGDVAQFSFARWIPDNVSVSLCSVPPVGQARVSTIVSGVWKTVD